VVVVATVVVVDSGIRRPIHACSVARTPDGISERRAAPAKGLGG
jgi:hypothetical protein